MRFSAIFVLVLVCALVVDAHIHQVSFLLLVTIGILLVDAYFQPGLITNISSSKYCLLHLSVLNSSSPNFCKHLQKKREKERRRQLERQRSYYRPRYTARYY